jgi:hypothetical protein
MRRRELFANGAGIFILSFVLAEAVISLIAGASGWNKDDSVRAIVSLSVIAALLIVLLRAGTKHFIGIWRSRR